MEKDFGYIIKSIETCLYGEKKLVYFCFDEAAANKIANMLREEQLYKKYPDKFVIQKVEVINKDEIQDVLVWIVDTGYDKYDPVAVCPTEEQAIECASKIQKDPKAKQYHEIGPVPIWKDEEDRDIFVFHWN